MGDNVARAAQPTRVRSGQGHTFTAGPDKITIRELSLISGEGGDVISNKWIYLFEEDTGNLYAEIYAENEALWHIEYRPYGVKSVEAFDKKREAVVVVNRSRLAVANYRVFLSPVRASEGAIDLLKQELSQLEVVVIQGQDAQGTSYVYVADYFRWAESKHRLQYLPVLHAWETFVSDEDRQAKLFIASVVENWTADGDPAEVKQYLRDKDEPARIIDDYKQEEQKAREEAEQEMVFLAGIIDAVQHQAIDLSTQEGGEEELAVGLLHWGIVSQGMLRVAPGRVFANKLMEEDKVLPAKVLFSESQNPDLPGAYATFKKAYAASINTVTELLAAKVKHLRKSVGSPRGTTEKVQLYLRNLSIETELKGMHKLIHERLEAGDRITKKLKGPRRSRVIRSYQRLVKKAGAEIPDYNQQATKLLDTADRLEFRQLSIEEVGQSLQFLFDLISLVSAIEEYRAAFPDAKDEKLINIVGAGGDFYQAATEVADSFTTRATFLRITGGAAGFISGVIDMLDAEEKGVRAAMNNHDYAAATGHGITAVGASMTALAGGVLLAKGISGGALFGGPFGAVVGAIGAGLMAVGMLVVAFFSDNDYQTYVRHCFLGEDHGTSVTPDWSTVSFGGGSLRSEVTALYDLLYRYKVSFVKTVKEQLAHGVGQHTYEWTGLKLTIHLQYGQSDQSQYQVDLVLTHDSRHISGRFAATNLVLPDARSTTGTSGQVQTPYIERRWSAKEVVDEMLRQGNARADSESTVRNLYLYPGEFTLKVQLIEGGRPIGKMTRIKATTGGRKKFGHIELREWNRVDFE